MSSPLTKRSRRKGSHSSEPARRLTGSLNIDAAVLITGEKCRFVQRFFRGYILSMLIYIGLGFVNFISKVNKINRTFFLSMLYNVNIFYNFHLVL